MSANVHIPVMLDEVILMLQNCPEVKIIFDGTFGGGGYSAKFLNLYPKAKIIATDLDKYAIQNFEENFKLKDRVKLIHSNYLNGIQKCTNKFSFIVLDLGFSSNQLEIEKRGFSFKIEADAELFDLRFNTDDTQLAYEKIRYLKSAKELSKIIFQNSGETFANKIAIEIYEVCKSNEFVTVKSIREAIQKAVPAKFQQNLNKIYSRVWQSIRIWVNGELETLQQFLPVAFEMLENKGLLCIVSFHSLEDKIVTKWMRDICKPIPNDEYGNNLYLAKMLTKKALTPSKKELENNPRSRSALLRCMQKLN